MNVSKIYCPENTFSVTIQFCHFPYKRFAKIFFLFTILIAFCAFSFSPMTFDVALRSTENLGTLLLQDLPESAEETSVRRDFACTCFQWRKMSKYQNG